jgi:hypothetical protein
MSTEEIALTQVEKQLRQRGWLVNRTERNCRDGDIHARKDKKLVRFEVKGLAQINGVWLKKQQVNAVEAVVVYVVRDDNVWVYTRAGALAKLDEYVADFRARNGRPPAAEGWNASQFGEPTGWEPLDKLLTETADYKPTLPKIVPRKWRNWC